MQKQILMLIGVLALSSARDAIAQVGAIDLNRPSHGQEQKKDQEKLKYTCVMHPEVVVDHPGKCPKCGMKLVPLKSDKTRPTPNAEHPPHEWNGDASARTHRSRRA